MAVVANNEYIRSDSRWLRDMFLSKSTDYDDFVVGKRYATEDFYKIVDTTPGGANCMNPSPQFTRYADPKAARLFPGLTRGLGQYYSEAIESHQRIVYFRMGVPAYTGLLTFFTNFYNNDAGRTVKTGNNLGIFYGIGKLVGFTIALPFQPFLLVGRMLKFLSGTPSTKFYYMKPTMPIYWNMVNTIVNGITANMGLTAPQENNEMMVPKRDADGNVIKENGNTQFENVQLTLDDSVIEEYAKLLPDVFHSRDADGNRVSGVDVYAISTRAQRISNLWTAALSDAAKDTNITSDESWVKRMLSYPGHTHSEMRNALEGTPLSIALERYYRTAAGSNGDKSTENKEASADEYFKTQEEIGKAESYLLAELRDGSQFVPFQVSGGGTVSESFSSSTKETEIGSKFNSISSSARSAMTSLSGGQTGIKLIDEAIGAANNLVQGIGEGLSMSGLFALAGSAYADIPKTWDNSTASLPRCEYTIHLRTPYGNKFSRFMNLYLPLAMLLAMALPRSTGSQSYGAPFLIECYDKGRAQTRLGIIDTMTVTRGVGNIGWTSEKEPLGIDVTLSVVDLSSVMHMPIGSSTGPLEMLSPGGLNRAFFGDDNAYTDYLAILGGLGLVDQVYPTRKIARSWRRMMLDWNSFFSTSHAASWMVNGNPVGRVLQGLSNVRSNG